MSIIGIGTDVVQIKRIALVRKRYGQRFIRRIFTTAEQQAAEKLSESERDSFYAKRFAAKEAFSKALGTGIGEKAGWLDISVATDKAGAPYLCISGQAQKTLTQKCPAYNILLSLADDFVATAFVIIEAA